MARPILTVRHQHQNIFVFRLRLFVIAFGLLVVAFAIWILWSVIPRPPSDTASADASLWLDASLLTSIEEYRIALPVPVPLSPFDLP